MAASFFDHRGQDSRYVEDLGRLGQGDDVVDDRRRLVAVQVGALVRLMVNQNEDAVLRAKQRVETDLCGHGGSSGYAGGRSDRSGVKKDVQGLDSTSFETGDIGARHGYGT